MGFGALAALKRHPWSVPRPRIVSGDRIGKKRKKSTFPQTFRAPLIGEYKALPAGLRIGQPPTDEQQQAPAWGKDEYVDKTGYEAAAKRYEAGEREEGLLDAWKQTGISDTLARAYAKAGKTPPVPKDEATLGAERAEREEKTAELGRKRTEKIQAQARKTVSAEMAAKKKARAKQNIRDRVKASKMIINLPDSTEEDVREAYGQLAGLDAKPTREELPKRVRTMLWPTEPKTTGWQPTTPEQKIWWAQAQQAIINEEAPPPFPGPPGQRPPIPATPEPGTGPPVTAPPAPETLGPPTAEGSAAAPALSTKQQADIQADMAGLQTLEEFEAMAAAMEKRGFPEAAAFIRQGIPAAGLALGPRR